MESHETEYGTIGDGDATDREYFSTGGLLCWDFFQGIDCGGLFFLGHPYIIKLWFIYF